MADTRIVIDGDSTGFVAAADRGAKAVDKIKDKTKSLGQEMEQTFTGMAKGVLIVGALTKAIGAAAEAANKLREASIKSSESSGSTELTVSRALAGTGLNQLGKKAVSNLIGSGAMASDATSGFIEALAKQQGQKLNNESAINLVSAFASGAFTQDELLAAAKQGKSVNIASQIAALSPEARDELNILTQLNQQAEQNKQKVSGNPAARFIEGERQRRRIESPRLQLVQDILGAVSFGAFSNAEADVIESQQRRARNLGGESTTFELGTSTINKINPSRPLIGGQSPKE